MKLITCVYYYKTQVGTGRSILKVGHYAQGFHPETLTLLKMTHLKNALFSWQDIVADAKENEERSLNTRLESSRVIEKHVRKVNYRSTDRKELGMNKFNSDYKGLVQDPLFEDYISNRYSRMQDAVSELNMARALIWKF